MQSLITLNETESPSANFAFALPASLSAFFPEFLLPVSHGPKYPLEGEDNSHDDTKADTSTLR